MHFIFLKMTYIFQIAILCLKMLILALHIYNCFYLDGVLVAEMVETLEFDKTFVHKYELMRFCSR